MVDDFGVLVNPLIVEGQIHGGIVQGAGQILIEDARYDASGQLLSGSFMDYAMPRADDFPSFGISFLNVPCTTNVLGIKGAGEAGTVGALGATMNAVLDALSAARHRHARHAGDAAAALGRDPEGEARLELSNGGPFIARSSSPDREDALEFISPLCADRRYSWDNRRTQVTSLSSLLFQGTPGE